MIELSDKVKCDASSFEVEWRRLSPNGCEYRQVDRHSRRREMAGIRLLRLVMRRYRKPDKGAVVKQILCIVRFGGPRHRQKLGLHSRCSTAAMAMQPARAGQFSRQEEAQEDDHLAQFLVVCQDSRR